MRSRARLQQEEDSDLPVEVELTEDAHGQRLSRLKKTGIWVYCTLLRHRRVAPTPSRQEDFVSKKVRTVSLMVFPVAYCGMNLGDRRVKKEPLAELTGN